MSKKGKNLESMEFWTVIEKMDFNGRGHKEAGRWLGRTQFDSVEVDNEVVINTNKRLKSGDMVMVKITKAYDYDLEGELV